MTTILILTNLATAILAVAYYVRYHWTDDDYQTVQTALAKALIVLAIVSCELDEKPIKTIEGENK
ncbi:hypothetical protein [Arcanobacterium phocae]|uniref:hypothetical protein n=1 Tax=Arcanobacterium phocae TaxID=131112 RepID=UPI001C0ECF1D|nr:hypothetical protein [Arcanobacterium phocae]